jgi:glycosyltransferase involved in cell wall biosynthesis
MSIYHNTLKDHFVECIKSINDQSVKPKELILVQDGIIPFDVNEILFSLLNCSTKVIVNEINMGLPYSLNLGLNYCTYDIVFRMDADDICEKNRFAIQYNEMLNNENLIVLGSNVFLINSDSFILNKKRHVPLFDSMIRKILLFKNPFNHPSVVFRKKYVNQVGGYSNLYLYEDWYLWFKMSKLKNCFFRNIDEPLLGYRIRSFDERKGLRIIKAEFKFYKQLYLDNYINLITFIFLFIIKSLVRILPSSSYLFFKHKFDTFRNI